ncbi:MAG: VCBS repeat-containing protein [Deltaproteobacteria bacterium]|nr:VCBS repeat-containing protein [Deltaproteobacteria bacterium]
MTFARPFALTASLALVLLSACGGGGGGASGTCRVPSDCLVGQTCVDGRCIGGRADSAVPDASRDAAVDAPTCPSARSCAGLCCAEGEICGGGSCCPLVELCGGLCCGADQRCVADSCVLDCAEGRAPCGSGVDALCCGAGDVCYLGACTAPGAACTSTRDCADGEYCEASISACLPRATGGDACEYRPPVGTLALAEEWAWSGSSVLPAYNQIMMAPMVANLDDDNGDGVIDQNDIPDVLFHTFAGSNYWSDGILRAVRGSDGTESWPTADPGYRTSPGGELAIADVDPGSPGPEILACSPSNSSSRPRRPGYLMVIAHDGTLLRRLDTPPNDVPCGYDAPAVADMDGDGVPEILVRWVIAHGDGTVVRRIRDSRGASGPYNTMADVDGDGDLEVVGGDGVYRMDGTAVWERTAASPGPGALPAGAHVAIADLDLDGSPEIVLVSAGEHSIRAISAATGADVWGPVDINPPELASVIAANGNPTGGGPPTIANFDDDPEPEIAFAGGFAYVVFEGDGTRKWYFQTQDRSSRSTGSSIFDFEGDGQAEVLYNDELFFRVFRGSTGEVLYEQCNTSGTLKEFPIVADVDNDDHAEIILMENNYAFPTCVDGTPSSTGIHVLGNPANDWVRTRRIWNQHSYHVTNIDEDGTVPRREAPNWSAPRLNNFRQNVQPDGLFDAPDLVLRDLVVSTRGCPAELRLSVRVLNQGRASSPAGVPISVYETSGARTLIGRVMTTRVLLPGESELLELSPAFPVPSASVGTTFRFEAVINDPTDMPLDSFHECREDNDAIGPTEAGCPLIG